MNSDFYILSVLAFPFIPACHSSLELPGLDGLLFALLPVSANSEWEAVHAGHVLSDVKCLDDSSPEGPSSASRWCVATVVACAWGEATAPWSEPSPWKTAVCGADAWSVCSLENVVSTIYISVVALQGGLHCNFRRAGAAIERCSQKAMCHLMCAGKFSWVQLLSCLP